MKSAAKGKPFICDMPARMLQKHADLSKAARNLYVTMRALANGKTGELAIKGSPLDWQYICRRAEIGRYTWLKALRELIAAGYVSCERKRVFVYRNGRKRAVLGRAHYFAHRQPKTIKKPMILLKSDSRTVGESDPQIIQKHPTASVEAFASASELESRKHTHKSSSPKADDDLARVTTSDSTANATPNPFLTSEDETLIRNVQDRLRVQYPVAYRRYSELIDNPGFILEAVQLIGERGTAAISVEDAYFAAGVTKILECDADVAAIKGILERKEARRRKLMPALQLTLEQDAARRKFNALVSGVVAN